MINNVVKISHCAACLMWPIVKMWSDVVTWLWRLNHAPIVQVCVDQCLWTTRELDANINTKHSIISCVVQLSVQRAW